MFMVHVQWHQKNLVGLLTSCYVKKCMCWGVWQQLSYLKLSSICTVVGQYGIFSPDVAKETRSSGRNSPERPQKHLWLANGASSLGSAGA